MKYHQYLEQTLELLPDYGDIKDIVSRHETLKQTNSELMSRFESLFLELILDLH